MRFLGVKMFTLFMILLLVVSLIFMIFGFWLYFSVVNDYGIGGLFGSVIIFLSSFPLYISLSNLGFIKWLLTTLLIIAA